MNTAPTCYNTVNAPVKHMVSHIPYRRMCCHRIAASCSDVQILGILFTTKQCRSQKHSKCTPLEPLLDFKRFRTMTSLIYSLVRFSATKTEGDRPRSCPTNGCFLASSYFFQKFKNGIIISDSNGTFCQFLRLLVFKQGKYIFN